MNKQAVVVASGGMDSATLAWHYRDKGFSVRLVGFDYGQRHKKELQALSEIAERLGGNSTIISLALQEHLHGSALTSAEVEVPDGHYAQETMKATVVPNRNAIMLSIATGIAVADGAEVVATGVHAGDHFIYPDCRPAFFEPFAQAMKAANDGFAVEGFRLEAPFISMSKADIAAYGASIGVDYSITWSCYKGGDIHCGRCGTCVERIEAFLDAGVEDPTEYGDREFALAEIGRA